MGLRGILRHPSIVIGGFLALAALSVMNSAYSYVLEAIRGDLELTYTQSGSMMSAYFIGYAIGQIPWGILADRRGSRLSITLSVSGVSASTVLFGLSSGYAYAAITRFLAGLLGAGIFVPSVRLVSSWFEPEERGTALGLLSIGGSVGLVAASWVIPFTATSLGWRHTIEAFGLFSLISSPVIWFLLRGEKEERETGEVNLTTIPLKDKRFWILALYQFIRLGSYYTFIAWLPLVLREDYGLPLLAVSGALSLFNIAGILSNPLGGIVSDKTGQRTVLSLSFILLSLTLIAFTSKPNGVTLYLTILSIGWFINFVRSPVFTAIPKIFGTKAAGSISGIHNTFASIGALTLPFTLGLIKDTTQSFNSGWLAISFLLVSSSALVFLVKTPQKPLKIN
jgi:nitrate/nitrite transporter NarK